VRVVLSWLLELCPAEVPPEELAEMLSVKGVHVEAVLRPWEHLSDVVVARVLEVLDHPNSDKLCLARVSYGSGERELVVGVRNMKPGDLVPLAGPGARVPALPEPLGERSIRGVVSEGMLCSPRELGISGDHGGILVLPNDAPVGADFKKTFGLDEVVFDIEIEPNRPDLMSVLGVAREVAASTGVPLGSPNLSVPEVDEKAEGEASVEVLDLEGCPRYIARIIRDVTVAPSPIQIQARLTAAGMRPVSNVVDATNYAMLEIGQPLHPFDVDKLADRTILVRRARDGERLLTLDDMERVLTAEDLVIADRKKAVGIAGVMGSASAEVHPGTREILLESAFFERKGVIRTSRRLKLQTEASTRFGRGADPENPPRGADLASRLLAEWAGGRVLSGAIDIGRAPERRRVRVRPGRATAVLGYPVSEGDVEEVFHRLGIATAVVGPDEVEVEAPGYRVDLEREVDLIEEIVRVQGYDRLGLTLPGNTQVGGAADSYTLRRRARAALVVAGLREAISLSFSSPADLELMGIADAVTVANPVSAEEGFLRPSLLPNLLKSVGRNRDRAVRSVALFEVGHVFRPGDPVDEREMASGVLTGPAGEGLHQEARAMDFFDAKGVVETLLETLLVRDWSLGDPPLEGPFHPARSAVVLADGHAVGVVGELHPGRAEALGLEDAGRVAMFELDLSALASHAAPVEYREIPRFPPVRRDLAFVVDEATPAAAVRAAIAEAAGDLLESVVLFDVFTGEPVPEAKKSLAFALEFRAPDRTLTDQEAEAAVEAIVRTVTEAFGGELRA
jgi:phenylalanyl-tRNA synthetase beta chain